MLFGRTFLAFGLLAALTTFARADGDDYFLHLGPTAIILDSSASIKVYGQPLAGASLRADNSGTLGFEIGRYLTPNWAISFTGGFPPQPSIYGSGTVAGLGKLGSILYGPTAVTAHYHFTQFGAFTPYIGAGPMFMFVLANHDGALQDLKVNSAIGAVAQIGADYMINQKVGLYFDVKKAYLRTESWGTLAGAPVAANAKLDPLVLSTGIAFRF